MAGIRRFIQNLTRQTEVQTRQAENTPVLRDSSPSSAPTEVTGVPISSLPGASTPGSNDVVPGVQSDTTKKFKLGAPIALGIGFVTSALSELIQYFVPTRAGTWMDIGIDFAGYFVGVLACYLILLFVIWIKKRKKKDPQE